MDGAPPQLKPVQLDELVTLPWVRTAAVVTHPCWMYEIAGRSPAALITLLPAELEDGDEAYLRCRDALCASAAIVVTGSETFYFEQRFRRIFGGKLDAPRKKDHFVPSGLKVVHLCHATLAVFGVAAVGMK